MYTGSIEAECKISDTESLVLLKLRDARGDATYYVGIAVHPVDGPLSFHTVEHTQPSDAQGVFARRSFFNCQKAYTRVYQRSAVELNAGQITMIVSSGLRRAS